MSILSDMQRRIKEREEEKLPPANRSYLSYLQERAKGNTPQTTAAPLQAFDISSRALSVYDQRPALPGMAGKTAAPAAALPRPTVPAGRGPVVTEDRFARGEGKAKTSYPELIESYKQARGDASAPVARERAQTLRESAERWRQGAARITAPDVSALTLGAPRKPALESLKSAVGIKSPSESFPRMANRTAPTLEGAAGRLLEMKKAADAEDGRRTEAYLAGQESRRKAYQSMRSLPDYMDTVRRAEKGPETAVSSGPLRQGTEEFQRRKNEAIDKLRSGERESARFSGLVTGEGEAIAKYLVDSNFRAGQELGALSGGGRSRYAILERLSADERSDLLYLAGKGKYDGVEEYLELLRPLLEERQYNLSHEKMTEAPPALKAVFPLLAGPANAAAYIQNAGRAVSNAVTGGYRPTDINSGAVATARLAGAAQGQTLAPLPEWGQFLGNVGYSMASNAAALPLGPAGALAMIGAQAAGQGTVSALERGASPGRALASGTATGAIEAITEKLPIDNLFRLANSAGKAVGKEAVRQVVKQAGIEATEELVSEIAGTLSDIAIMGDRSEYWQTVNSLMAQGMSRDDAKKSANRQFFVTQPLLSAAGGGLSGGIFGAGGTIIGNKRAGKSIQGQPPASFANEGGLKDTQITSGMVAANQEAGDASSFSVGAQTPPDAQYSINPDFKRQFDEWDKKSTGGYFHFGSPSDALKSIGVPDKGIYMPKSKILQAMNPKSEHHHPEMSLELFRQLPDMIENPVVITQSRSIPNSIVLFGELYSTDGRPVMASMHLNAAGRGTQIDKVNVVTSAYARTELDNYIKSSDILYLATNKERTANWFQARRLQLPVGETEGGSINKVALLDEKVKGVYSPQDDRKFKTSMELAFEQAKQKQITPELYKAAALGRNLGRRVEVAELPAGHNGMFKDGVIYLNKNSPAPALTTLAHELTHSIEGSVHYSELNNLLLGKNGLGAILEQSGMTMADMTGSLVSDYAEAGIDLSEADAQRELAARYVEEKLLTDEAAIKGLIKTNRNLAQRIFDWIGNAWRRLTGSSERRMLAKAYNLYSKALHETDGRVSPVITVPEGEDGFIYGDSQSAAAGNKGNAGQYRAVRQGLENESLEQFIRRLAEKKQSERSVSAQTKEQRVQSRAENGLAKDVAEILSVPGSARQDILKPIAGQIAAEYLKNGEISEVAGKRLFESAYEAGRVINDDFYNTFKPIRDYLREQPLRISEADRAAITDFADFRKRNFGKVRIVNEGGLPVDVAYMELSERYPAFFPEDIAHPADQLYQIAEVADMIKKTEETLDTYHGKYAREFKEAAQREFDKALGRFAGEMEQIRKYKANQTEGEAGRPEAPEEISASELMKIGEQMNELRKVRDRVVASTLLSDADNAYVDMMLKKGLRIEDVPEHLNREGIRRVYEAKKAVQDAEAPIARYNARRKEFLRNQARDALAESNAWKDKRTGVQYQRETMERNIYDIVRDADGNPDDVRAKKIIETYFEPVHISEAERTKMRNAYRDRVRALNLSEKAAAGNTVSEAYAVQFLGEVNYIIDMMEKSNGRVTSRDGGSLEEWKAAKNQFFSENPNLDLNKINSAIDEFRKIYDELFARMNEARVRNGYAPVEYRKGYFPHFTENAGDQLLGQMAQALGIDANVDALPTSIAGITQTFKPGIRWDPHTLRRTGNATEYNAVKGFDKYIEGISDIVHHTDDIQRLRVLAEEIRYMHSPEAVRERVDQVRANEGRSVEDKERDIKDIFEKNNPYALSNFVNELEEYTNLLANKKSFKDRGWERDWNRGIYRLGRTLENRVAANMVAVNPASWLTNFIPLTQGWAGLKTNNLLTGMWDTLRAYRTDDGFAGESVFLTNRRGSDPVSMTASQKLSQKLSQPMTWIDTFVADSLVRARTRENTQKGMTQQQAIREADAWTAGIMADRSKGSTPTRFAAKNPVSNLFNQFQLEVNNQLSYLMKDIPRDKRDKGVAALAAALFKFMIGAFLYNELYERLIGRRAALDPIGLLKEAAEDVRDEGVTAAGINFAKNVAEDMPFIGGVLGGGRVPISSALPDVERLWKAGSGLVTGEMPAKKALSTLGSELIKPSAYIVPPFGGGALKKAGEAAGALSRGGDYTVDAQGRDILRYPVERDIKTGAKAVIFGKTSTEGGRKWVNSGFKNYSASETDAYQEAFKAGAIPREVMSALDRMKAVEKGADKRRALKMSLMTDEARAIIYKNVLADNAERDNGKLNEREKFEKFVSDGMDTGALYRVFSGLKDAEKDAAKRTVLKNASLTDAQKAKVYIEMLADDSKTEDGKLNERMKMEHMTRAGADPAELYRVFSGVKGLGKQSERREVLIKSKLPERQKKVAYELLVSDEHGEKITALTGAGLSFDQFLKIYNEYSRIGNKELKPKEQATEFAHYLDSLRLAPEQWGAVSDQFKYFQMNPADPQGYRLDLMSESAQKRFATAQTAGYTEDEYVELYPLYTQQKKKDEIIADALDWGLTRREAEALWTIIKGQEKEDSGKPTLTKRTLVKTELPKPALVKPKLPGR